ncbi:MAG: hypothetical protein CMB56_002685 [Methanobacteriota archaeon]|nr:MAG: hypothetical protein CMB56_002685 [Euryarchaeota archaeon]|tara:strand:+ start:40377 stop:40949 length:573 start_codon:yes stop_codon:yes gene_type:complete
MSEVQKNLVNRRTIYHFSTREVDKKILEIAFEAARFAPSHKHTNPWKFYVMGQECRSSIIKDVEELSIKKCEKKGLEISDEIIERAKNKILKVPVLVAVTSKLSPDNLFLQEEDYAATVCAIQNLTLSLWDNGIGSQWSTGSITRRQSLYDALEISRKDERIIGLIKIGYPEKVPSPKKKQLSEIRFYLN